MGNLSAVHEGPRHILHMGSDVRTVPSVCNCSVGLIPALHVNFAR